MLCAVRTGRMSSWGENPAASGQAGHGRVSRTHKITPSLARFCGKAIFRENMYSCEHGMGSSF